MAGAQGLLSEEILQLDQQAFALYQVGKSAEALQSALRVCELTRAACGEQSRAHAESLSNLALLYRAMGDYQTAAALYTQVHQIEALVLGAHDSLYALTLSNLGLCYRELGNDAAAQPLYRQALDIRREQLGARHQDTAQSLNNLAELLFQLGDYTGAEPLLVEAMHACRASYGVQHPAYALSLSNLAMQRRTQGALREAVQLLQDAIQIFESHTDACREHLVGSLESLTHLYQLMSEERSAAACIERICALRSEYDPASDVVAISIESWQAELTYALEATLLLHLAQQRARLGKAHPEIIEILTELAHRCAVQGRVSEALDLLLECAEVEDRLVAQIRTIGAERQQLIALRGMITNLALMIGLLTQAPDAHERTRAAFALLLRRKGLVLDHMLDVQQATVGEASAELRHAMTRLRNLRRRIVRQVFSDAHRSGTVSQFLLPDWIAQKEALEQEIAQLVPRPELRANIPEVDLDALAAVLPVGSVLVEVLCAVPEHPLLRRWSTPAGQSRYVAFVLHAGRVDRLTMVDLGSAAVIDAQIHAYRGQMLRPHTLLRQDYRDLGGLPDEPVADERSRDTAGHRLRQLLFDPIATLLDGCQCLLIAPDGELCTLPFEILPTDQGGYLIDHYQISYLSTGRDLLRDAHSPGTPGTPLVVANPDYNLSREPRRSLQTADTLSVPPLAATQIEGEQIAALLGAALSSGQAARESIVKACQSPEILHLATHGFFLAERPQSEFEAELIRRIDRTWSENPLLRSGLLLAGVNTGLQGGALPTDAEDGILTAEDIASLDLRATTLVVLSACDTGIGAIQHGEGVLGLRRSFMRAGARTLVLSLWRVADLATAILMDRFYIHLLQGEMPRNEALRCAQQDLRRVTIGELRRSWLAATMVERIASVDPAAAWEIHALTALPDHEQPFRSPFYWGAFICQGEIAALPRSGPSDAR